MADNSMHHIKRVSRKYILLFNALLVVVPVAGLFYWALFNRLPVELHSDLPVMPSRDLTIIQLVLGALVSLLPIGVIIYGLVTLKGLFRLYADGIIFANENVKYFRQLGYTFIAWVIAATLFTPLISMVVSFTNPVGQRELVVGFELIDIFTLIIAGIVLIIAWVMNEGRKLEDEQAHTV